MYIPLIVIVLLLLLACLRQVNQYERGVRFTMGRFSSVAEPGWRIVIPVFQSMTKVDMRLKAVDVPPQEAITKDNVSAKVNAVIYYKVVDSAKAIIEVESAYYAVLQLAQTTMRNIVGECTLDELLSQRQQISDKIESIVDKVTLDWGVEVTSVELKDINLPTDMVRTIAKQAEAERERRAVIINAEGEVAAAENLARAAEILARHPGALHLRTLNSINDISSDQSNTVIFTVPLEVLQSYIGYKNLSAIPNLPPTVQKALGAVPQQ
ncbi:MAG: slipin family protein [Patescibacteria group bacterium]|nr:slipin family protein [Patescibacteria group bacterium]